MKTFENVISLPKPDIFSFAECLDFLDRGYDDCLYSLEENRVRKPLIIGGSRILIEVKEAGDHLDVGLLAGDSSQQVFEKAVRYVEHWFDLQRKLDLFYELLARHEKLADMADRFYGLRLMGIPDLFEALCWCVIGQQINLTFAYRLKCRLVENYGSTITYDRNRYYFFPEPEVLAALEVPDLKELQFSRQKAEYIIGIAKQFAARDITKREMVEITDGNQLLKRLKQIRGVGDWTANYVAMKSLKQMSCITYGDTGLQTAVSNMLGLSRKPSRDEVNSFFEPFVGWESYLVIYLWRTLS